MQRGSFRAMGTTISYLLPATEVATGARLIQALFAAWEETLSRFRPESELSRLNRSVGQFVEVSELLFLALERALEAAEASEGLYDPALLEQLADLGYDRTFEEVPRVLAGRDREPEAARESRPGGAWRAITLDPVRRRVRLPAGARLDLGGIAKGLAVDASLAALRRRGIIPALVNAGGDLAVEGLPPGCPHWPIAVPAREGGWTLPLLRGAMATSGIARRHWWRAGRLYHHLLDPRSGLPVEHALWSVTVAAERCEQAEVAAKVAFILGPQEGAAFLRRLGIAGLLVERDGTWSSVDPWPAALMRPWPSTGAQAGSHGARDVAPFDGGTREEGESA